MTLPQLLPMLSNVTGPRNGRYRATCPAHVAQQLGRQGVGIELNPAYIALAEIRTEQTGLLL